MSKNPNKFMYLIFALVIISTVAAFVRYIVFSKFIIYDDESSIPGTPASQIDEIIRIGL